MEYKDTLNLPATDFPMQANLLAALLEIYRQGMKLVKLGAPARTLLQLPLLAQARRVTAALIDTLDAQDRLQLIEFSNAPRAWRRDAAWAKEADRPAGAVRARRRPWALRCRGSRPGGPRRGGPEALPRDRPGPLPRQPAPRHALRADAGPPRAGAPEALRRDQEADQERVAIMRLPLAVGFLFSEGLIRGSKDVKRIFGDARDCIGRRASCAHRRAARVL